MSNLRIFLVSCCLIILAARCENQPFPEKSKPKAIAFVENNFIRVGVNLKWGGAITHVSEPDGPNLINSHDLGRQIQQSYYSGPPNYQREGKEKSPDWATFPWNPIQSGDAYNNGSKVLDYRIRDGELYIKTVPMLWPMNNDPAECIMETWIKLYPEAAKFEYRTRLTNARRDETEYPGGWSQEIPAVYVNGPWHRLITYNGDNPFGGEEVSEVRNDHNERWPWVRFIATEGWAALVNDTGSGIGIYSPITTEFHGGFHGNRGYGDEKSGNTGYMSPITTEILDYNIIYEYSCNFVLGNIDQIRAEAGRLASTKLPSWNFDSTRQGWHYKNGGDAGWPIAGRGLALQAIDRNRPVQLISPFTFWRAEHAGEVAVRISSNKTGTIKVFWRDMPPADASVKPSLWSKWQKQWWKNEQSAVVEIPVCSRKLVTVKLAGLPGYGAGMTGLAIELPDGVTVHDVSLIANGAAKQ